MAQTKYYKTSGFNGLVSPFLNNLHSTNTVELLSAFEHSASASEICKASTWSSVDMFSKFYQGDISDSSIAIFGHSLTF